MQILPVWLKKILDDSGNEQGKYTFSETEVVLSGLPKDFVGIAESEDGGLAVAKKGDGVICRFEHGRLDVFAVDAAEFRLQIRRDEAWEELSENMPATEAFWLGIILKMKNPQGELMTLGFKGASRDSVMVVQGEMRESEMLEDALNRELAALFSIAEYQVIDVSDDGGVYESEKGSSPLFTVVVEVEDFDPTTIGDPTVGWLVSSTHGMAN